MVSDQKEYYTETTVKKYSELKETVAQSQILVGSI